MANVKVKNYTKKDINPTQGIQLKKYHARGKGIILFSLTTDTNLAESSACYTNRQWTFIVCTLLQFVSPLNFDVT